MPNDIQTERRLTGAEKEIEFFKTETIPRIERKIDRVNDSVKIVSNKIDKICDNYKRPVDKDGKPKERRNNPPEATTKSKWKDLPWWKQLPIVIVILGVLFSSGIFWIDRLILLLEGLKSFLGP